MVVLTDQSRLETPRFSLSYICNTRRKDLLSLKNRIDTTGCLTLAGAAGIDRQHPPVYDCKGLRLGIRKVRALRTGFWVCANEFARIA
jgi:hypothetical protein